MYFDHINISFKTPHRSHLNFLINIMFFLSKQTSYEIQFVLADCYCTWGLPWSVVGKLSITPLKKTHFPSSNRYKL